MLNYKIKIGLVPERRFLPGPKRTGIFNPDYAVANKNEAVKYIRDNFEDELTEFTDLEWLNEEGLLFLNEDVDRVAEYLREQKVDAIFIMNCNFGNEEAAGRIAKKMGLPTLLWGPRDMIFEPDGTRYTDSQCGLFAISNQLRRAKLPFSYIENCRVTDKAFADGLKKFESVVCMLKNFRNLEVVQVGVRLKPFKSVMSNEVELAEKFGINVTPVNLVEAMQKLNFIYDNRKDELKAIAADVRANWDADGIDEETMLKNCAFVLFYKEIFEEENASVISTECWTAMRPGFGANPCMAMSVLADMGYLISCESDIHGAITMAMLSCAARGKSVPFFGEFTCRHPSNDAAELLWHCGPFARSVKADDVPAGFDAIARPSFRVRDGHYTVSRFQNDGDKYRFFGQEFDTTDGPATVGTYLWADFGDAAKIERKLIEGPYIHHMAEISGAQSEVIKEFCKYVDGLEFDCLD
jgi:L-fucose isomerase-like protein